MQNQDDEFMNASNDYFKRLDRVNLLLLKEHTFLLQKAQYEQQIVEIERLIEEFKENPDHFANLSTQAEFDYLHKMIKLNKKQISQLQSKLEQKQNMINYLTSLQQIRKKYQKLIELDYQNGIQQKLSMIRGKVDDLKKKIKEINKDILSYEQEHSELIDQYSFEVRNLEICKQKNQALTKEIQQLKVNHKK